MSDELLNTERAAVTVREARRYFQRGPESVRALDGVSFDVARGEVVCLRGPSGSGKSTLLNVIGCLDEVSHGSVNVLGIETTRLSPLDAGRFRRNHIGFVFQELSLVPYLTALENVMLPLVMDQAAVLESQKQAEKQLYRVELGARLDHFPRELSSGERQRVAIARALVRTPTLLLADEPSANLDSSNVDRIAKLFRGLASDGRSVIIATHDDRLARQADRTVWLSDGRIAPPAVP